MDKQRAYEHNFYKLHLASAHKLGSYVVPKKHQDRYSTLGKVALAAFDLAEIVTRPAASHSIYKILNI
jgi:hypothetical protein